MHRLGQMTLSQLLFLPGCTLLTSRENLMLHLHRDLFVVCLRLSCCELTIYQRIVVRHGLWTNAILFDFDACMYLGQTLGGI